MVQLPATAAIEYVAVELERKRKRKRKLERKTKTVRGANARSSKFNAYTNRLGFLCLASYRDGQKTRKKTKNNDKFGPVAPRGVDPRSPNFQGM